MQPMSCNLPALSCTQGEAGTVKENVEKFRQEVLQEQKEIHAGHHRHGGGR
ncbi:MAG: hypothetical protein GX167_05770 [Firmicutes bacterium]|jgi:hypothetical protein|nr:hypothetical protein [Bacillota bacterium]